MAGAHVSIEVEDRALQQAFSRLMSAAANPAPALRDIGEQLLNAHRERFARQESPEGDPWAPLSSRYAARKKKNKDKILVLEGHLKDLLRYQVTEAGAALELGTDRIYGATHQFGDETRNIPARPFLGLSAQDQAEVLEIIEDHLRRAGGG